MKIYTRTGDDGTTGLFGGDRVEKIDPRVEAYGTVDETNSILGLARAAGVGSLDQALERIQTELFVLGSELACAPEKQAKLKLDRIGHTETTRLEQEIDQLEASLPPLKNFVLPGGGTGAAFLHQARCVCRRAERRVLEAQQHTEIRSELVHYLNRLSDLLFVQARAANLASGHADVPWVPRGGKQAEPT